MKRHVGLRRFARLRSRPVDPIPADVFAIVVRRSDGHCEIGKEGVCRLYGGHIHHRLPRSHGGENTAKNLMVACPYCHRWAHDNPEESYSKGWLVRTGIAVTPSTPEGLPPPSVDVGGVSGVAVHTAEDIPLPHPSPPADASEGRSPRPHASQTDKENPT